MGFKGFFKKLGSISLDVLQSPVGDILVAKYIPKKYKPLVDFVRKRVSEQEQENEQAEPNRTGKEQAEIIYRQAAIEAQRLGIPYKPSELFSLIEDSLQEQKGTAVFKE